MRGAGRRVQETTHTIHHLPEETVARVLRVRRIHGWRAEAIEAHLRSQGVQISHRSIYLILKRNNLITKSYKPRKQRSYIRFARQHPDSLWQTDIKYYGNRYLVAYLDDCSRYIPAASLYREATADNVLATRGSSIYWSSSRRTWAGRYAIK